MIAELVLKKAAIKKKKIWVSLVKYLKKGPVNEHLLKNQYWGGRGGAVGIKAK